ncbi:hypothetical protein HYW83_03450 [Candidatus Peregrinibacteria bacterium]|nr:hypothetical protein [Candidatus Peregrinibacteria bacterium]
MKNKNQWIKWVVGVLFIALVSGAVYFSKPSTQKGVVSGLPLLNAPDLKVISIDAGPGKKFNTTIVRAKIQNSGSMVVKKNFPVLFTARIADATPSPGAGTVSGGVIVSARVSIDGLGNGKPREVSHTFNKKFESIGYVLITADPDNIVSESNEDNNQAAKELPPPPNVPSFYTVLP